jgi:protoheme IX farnesyltransferase
VENNFNTFLKAFFRLIKYRLSAAVAFSAGAGYILYEKSGSITGFFSTVLGVFLLSAGSAALNQYQERHTDALMLRTKKRPLPAHELRSRTALGISVTLIFSGTALLILGTVWLAALLGLLNVVLYNLIYTNLKPKTSFAVVPGALVGAVPPLIGFTAAGGSPIAPQALFMAGFMFMWQLPHFWLLLSTYRREYEKAGFVSLVKIPGERDTKVIVPAWIVITSILLLFAENFGIQISQPLWFALAGVNIAVSALFLIVIPKNDQAVSEKKSFAVLNGFVFVVLTILALTAVT